MGLPETFGFFSARNAIIEGQYPHLEEKNKTTTKTKIFADLLLSECLPPKHTRKP